MVTGPCNLVHEHVLEAQRHSDTISGGWLKRHSKELLVDIQTAIPCIGWASSLFDAPWSLYPLCRIEVKVFPKTQQMASCEEPRGPRSRWALKALKEGFHKTSLGE
jgi:hypothetical protein